MCETSTEPMAEDRQLFVDKWLRVCGVADGSIMALGDCARLQGEEQLPETAQVAAQQGAFVARLLNKESLLEIERFWIYNHIQPILLVQAHQEKDEAPQFRKRREKLWGPRRFPVLQAQWLARKHTSPWQASDPHFAGKAKRLGHLR